MTGCYWLLAAFALAVNAVSVGNALREAWRAERKSQGRVIAVLLFVRCTVLLSVVIIAMIRWAEPQWLVSVSWVTVTVQALDLCAGILLRSGRLIVVSSVGVVAILVPLLTYVLVT